MTARLTATLILLLFAASAHAQESQFASDLRRERERIAQSCDELNAKALGDCAYTLVTDYPFHVALGNLAPQNGFAVGLAFTERYTPNESWRLSWNGDLVRAVSGSWRGGAYMKMIRTPDTSGVVVRRSDQPASTAPIAPREFAVVDLFVQTISLETIDFYGLGQDSVDTGRAQFGERQTILGGGATYPFGDAGALASLRPALVGGITGRFVDVRAGPSSDAPPIGQLYDAGAAPGLDRQDAFLELREGLRLSPSIANGWVNLTYVLSAQQFRTSGESRGSFNRWTMDLQHDIPLYRGVSSPGPRAFNGPNECAQAVGSVGCPPLQWSRNREGTVTVRLLLSTSTTGEENRVPFFFQPTLGGSDLNGERRLAGYDDYRFRGANVFLLQEGIEHSLWGPVGVFAMLEQGRVGLEPGDLGFSDLGSSATVGLTLRAGGAPLVHLSFSWSGEGHHVNGSMEPTLLGGSPRPSLY